MLLTVRAVAGSLEKGALCRSLFGLAKITQTNTDQAKALLQAQVDALPQCQGDGGQLFVGRRRSERGMTAGEYIEVAGLELEYNSARDASLLTRSRPDFFREP